MVGSGTNVRTAPPPRTAVFLLRRKPLIGVFSWLNPLPLGVLRSRRPAVLHLTDDTVRCVLVNKYGHARWLAERLQMPDLEERLETEEVTAFEFPRGGYEITWPKLHMDMLCDIGEPGSDRWITSFSLPSGDHMATFSPDWDLLLTLVQQLAALRDPAMRDIRRLWRQALDPNGSQVLESPKPETPTSARGGTAATPTKRVARPFIASLAAVAVVAVVAAGCSSARGGSAAAPNPGGSASSGIDTSQLDPGKYPTKPIPFEAVSDDEAGRLADAQRMANFVTGPWDVDPAFLGQFLTGAAALDKTVQLNVLGPAALVDVGDRHGFINGFHNARADGDRRELSTSVLRFPDAASAAAAATDLAAAVTKPGPHAVLAGAAPIAVPGHPDAQAVTGPVVGPNATVTFQGVESFTPHGPYVLMQYAQAADGGRDAAAALVARTLDLQAPLIDQFQPTQPSDFATLPMDPTGLLAQTLPVDPKELDPKLGMIRQRVVYQPQGALQFEFDPVRASKVFTDDGVDLVSHAKTNVYRARDAAAANRVVEALGATQSSSITPADGVKGLPGSRCSRGQGASHPTFTCWASEDRYAFVGSGPELLDAQQQIAAQYLMLAAR